MTTEIKGVKFTNEYGEFVVEVGCWVKWYEASKQRGQWRQVTGFTSFHGDFTVNFGVGKQKTCLAINAITEVRAFVEGVPEMILSDIQWTGPVSFVVYRVTPSYSELPDKETILGVCDRLSAVDSILATDNRTYGSKPVSKAEVVDFRMDYRKDYRYWEWREKDQTSLVFYRIEAHPTNRNSREMP